MTTQLSPLLIGLWYEKLNGNISLPVYAVDVPPEETGSYVLIRAEGEINIEDNYLYWNKSVTIITEIVTRFAARIDYAMAGAVDDEIAPLIFEGPQNYTLSMPEGIQLLAIRRQDSTYLSEETEAGKYYSLITRNVHTVAQD